MGVLGRHSDSLPPDIFCGCLDRFSVDIQLACHRYRVWLSSCRLLSSAPNLESRPSGAAHVADSLGRLRCAPPSRLLKKVFSTACALTLVSPEAGEKFRNGTHRQHR